MIFGLICFQFHRLQPDHAIQSDSGCAPAKIKIPPIEKDSYLSADDGEKNDRHLVTICWKNFDYQFVRRI